MAVQITPYRGSNPLKAMALGHQVQQGQQRLAQGQRQMDIQDTRNRLTQQQIDQAADRLKMTDQQFKINLQREIFANSRNAEEAIFQMDSLIPMDPRAMAAIRSLPPTAFGPQEKFGSTPQQVIGPDGKTGLALIGDQGSHKFVNGLTPVPRTGQTINLNTGSQNALQKALIEGQAGDFKQIQEAGRAARGTLQQLDVARNIDVKTAPFESTFQVARQIGNAFGFPVDEKQLSNVDAFNAVMGRLVNDRVSQEKGPQTDADVARFRKTMADVNNTPVAKNFLLNYAEAMERRKIHMAEFFREGVRGKGDYEKIRDSYQEYLDQTPLIRTNIQNNDTGLPVFFYEFEREYLKENPGASQDDVLAEWRKGSRK